MGANLQPYKSDKPATEIEAVLPRASQQLDRVSRAIDLAHSVAELAPLIQETMQAVEGIATAYFTYASQAKQLEVQLLDRMHAREIEFRRFSGRKDQAIYTVDALGKDTQTLLAQVTAVLESDRHSDQFKEQVVAVLLKSVSTIHEMYMKLFMDL